MTNSPTTSPLQRREVGGTSAATEPLQEETRLRQLFRLWIRNGHLHPLIHLIRQFNSRRPR